MVGELAVKVISVVEVEPADASYNPFTESPPAVFRSTL